MAVTTKDLARICGVSRATITRALNGTGRIKPETKENILTTAKELGYVPDLVARSLVKGSTKSLGVIVVDLKNQYFPEMINAMENRAKENNFLLNITLHESSKETEMQLIQTLIGHRVDGLILSPINKGEEFERYLCDLKIPLVIIGDPNRNTLPAVGIDEAGAARSATRYIIEKGYRDILFVVPPLKDAAQGYYNIGHGQRMEGFLQAVEEKGVKHSIIFGTDYIAQALDYMENAAEKPAFLCSGDMFAGNIMDRFLKKGYAAGKEYGIMGFDCLDMFQNWSPRLCTVNNHVEQIGYEAADLLIGMVQGKTQGKGREIPYNIVEGITI